MMFSPLPCLKAVSATFFRSAIENDGNSPVVPAPHAIRSVGLQVSEQVLVQFFIKSQIFSAGRRRRDPKQNFSPAIGVALAGRPAPLGASQTPSFRPLRGPRPLHST